MKKIASLLILLLLFSCKSHEARRPVSVTSGSFIKESIKRNKKLVAKEESQIKDIIQKDTLHNYRSASDGFWYYYNQKKEQDTLTPQFGDQVNFDYDISTLKGNAIYTKAELGTREFLMDQEEVFSGLRQALKLMKPGETATFLFPSHKAFGYYGDNDKIGTNVPIRSTITLNYIRTQNKKPLKSKS